MKRADWKAELLSLLAIIMVILAVAGVKFYGTSKEQKEEQTVQKKIATIEDLKGSKIGVQIGTTGDIYASDYEKDGSGTTIERYNKGVDAVQALKLGKIDCVIIDEQPAKVFVEKNENLHLLDEEFTNEEYAICIDKGNTELKEKVNGALDTLRNNGTLSDIIENYTGDDEIKGTKPYQKKEVERPNGTLRVAVNATFPPYESYVDGVMVGIDVDVMQAICDELGMTLKMEDMEFDSIILAVTSGKADVGCSGMTVTEDRLKNIDFTDSYTTTKQMVIVADSSATVNEKADSFVDKLKHNFVEQGRYQYIVRGLGNTLVITCLAVIIGIVLGFLIALVRTSHDRNGGFIVLNGICKAYLAIIRGTPALVQLLIIFYVILSSVNNKIFVAVIAFGLNSAAYVAEVVRSGIMAVDFGQFEAGRSLGLTYKQTMLSIVLPQALKNSLPALCNEFISLLKETSISGYIGLVDLTKAGDIIRSNTYEAYIPLLTIAFIYFIIVMFLTACVGQLERRLRRSESK